MNSGNTDLSPKIVTIGKDHLERTVELTPKSPITCIDYGKGLMLLYGSGRENDAAAGYEIASRLKLRDAMEWLDVEYANAQKE